MSYFGGGGGGSSSAATWLIMQQMAQQQAQLADQQQVASEHQVATIQQGLSADQAALLRDFGRKTSAMNSPSIGVPFSSSAGGFAQPLVTGTGSLRAA